MDVLWYKQPAKIWEEALPIGNGSMGGMVYGDILNDRICLNKDTLWSGRPIDQNAGKDKLNKGRSKLKEIRKFILEEDYAQARDIIEDNILGDWGESYLPLGDLLIQTKGCSDITDYRRELDLKRGIVKVSCLADGFRIEREYLCSYPAGAMIIHTSSEKPIDIEMRFTCQLKHEIKTEEHQLILDAKCPIHVEPDYMGDVPNAVVYGEGGICYQARLRVICPSQKILVTEDSVLLKGVRECTIYVTAADSFLDYRTKPCAEYQNACQDQSREAAKLTYKEHFKAHLEDYQKLYNRMEFKLESHQGKESKICLLPTDERLEAFGKGSQDEELFCLMVSYGRYLMIAASRPGSQPMNLQGIWNKNLRAVWSSNYTVNINTQMNYWPVLPCAMPELQKPLNDLVKDLSHAGKVTAKELYGCRGWVSHHNIDLWRLTTPVGGPWKRNGFSAVRHSMWPMSGVWLCRHLYEQYEYTLDLNYLRTTAYPIMEESALFVLDWLVTLPDGSLGSIPSTSPENEFVFQDNVYGVSESSSMDLYLIRELFLNCQKAILELGLNTNLSEELNVALSKLKMPQIGSDGRILEWAKEYKEAEVNHRHVSHLYGLYPSDLLPKNYLDAARKSLLVRGDEGTGWSLAWKTCLWARLLDAKRVHQLLVRQLRLVDAKEVDYKNGGIYKNLFMAHPPFQIDANFGITAAILETLVQCRNGYIFLLPALPENWLDGCVRGVAAKNALTLDLIWKNGELIECRVMNHALKKVINKFCYHGKECLFPLEDGEERILTKDDFE